MLLKKEIIFNMTMALNFNNSHIFKSCEGSCYIQPLMIQYPLMLVSCITQSVPMMHFKFTYTNALRKNRKISTSLTIFIAFEDELQLLMKN